MIEKILKLLTIIISAFMLGKNKEKNKQLKKENKILKKYEKIKNEDVPHRDIYNSNKWL